MNKTIIITTLALMLCLELSSATLLTNHTTGTINTVDMFAGVDQNGDWNWNAQSFTLNYTATITSVSLYLGPFTNPENVSYCLIIENDGNNSPYALPPNTTLADPHAIKCLNYSDMTENNWFNFTFDIPFTLSDGKYWLVFHPKNRATENYSLIFVGYDATQADDYTGGEMAWWTTYPGYGPDSWYIWSPSYNFDLVFAIYGYPPQNISIPTTTETSAAHRGEYYYRDANGNIYSRSQIEGTANNKAAPLAMIVPEGEPIKNPFTSLWQIIKNFLGGIGVNI